MRSSAKIAVGSLGLVLVLTGAIGSVSYYEKKVYEAHAAQLVLSWPSIDFYFFYKLFMSWVNSGVSGPNDIALSAGVKDKLQPFYQYDLSAVRYAYTTKFSNLGMADCTKIYFGNKPIVDALRLDQALSLGQVRWLAHELTHGEQCVRWGGRKNYATTWFRQLRTTVLSTILKGNFSSVVQNVFSAQAAAIHDDMSMEKEADLRSGTVVADWK